ncbi:hypothetical protein EV193_115144 [Herbihabitans rhizosphaerae]|uniref:Uncharacterized protein n=1 Tax=Herbihabitans rhizosphaerae TaxID=1872711 RepID=A0A4Q7KD41_9PSEU|nr:hypothetical protein [Herbihabitans rhizosphaerae]RZS31265.1 hypothetical protein EV193_115144 [Herbihabitans rhizosphaerae]
MDDIAWVDTRSCTLPSVEQPLRVAEFDALFAESLIVEVPPARTDVLDGLAARAASVPRSWL